jgi:hypothetical protein
MFRHLATDLRPYYADAYNYPGKAQAGPRAGVVA